MNPDEPTGLNSKERKELACAQRLAYRAAIFAERFLWDSPTEDTHDADTIRLLELALRIAKGEDCEETPPKKRSPGAPPTDWEALTGKTIDTLIFEARLAHVTENHAETDEAKGPPKTWKSICKDMLAPIEQQHGTDEYRKLADELAEHLKPSRIRARYLGPGKYGAFTLSDIPRHRDFPTE